MMKLGCIGYGNMAGAILGGLIKNNGLPAGDICVYDHLPEKAGSIERAGMLAASSIQEVGKRCNVILLAVKPKDLVAVLTQLAPFTGQNKVFVSIVAGIPTAKMEKTLGAGAAIVRAMPNTPLLLGVGTTALCKTPAVPPEAFSFVQSIFSCSGTVYDIPESEFNAVINLNGSSPAYIYLFAKIVADYTAKFSKIPSDTALQMICDTLKGSAEMMQKSGYTPDELIKMVSSPGGTTVAALQAFTANGFEESLQAGLAACVTRAIEMGEE